MPQEYRWAGEVRDYEIDMQGIVHHAVYLHYLEQCRSQYIKNSGVDVYGYHQLGYDLVVAGVELSYKQPLRPHDSFYVTAICRRQGHFRMVYDQEIRKQDGSVALIAKVTAVCIDRNGKPCMPEILEQALNAIEQLASTD